MSRRVFVLGGTGAVGPHAMRALVEAGYHATALVRSEAKAELVTGLGATPVVGSMFDTLRLTESFAGHDAVVNLATSIPSTMRYALPSAWRENARIRTDGTRSVVDAALAAGVPRLVQESIALVYRDGGSAWVDENTPLDVFSVATSTPVSESEIERFTTSGGTGVVLRFGMFYGPGSKQSAEMLLAAKLRFGPVLGHPDRYWSPICLPDAGSAVAAAIDAPAGVYNVVDDEPVTKRAFAEAISAAVGRRSWVRGPGRLIGLPGDQMSATTRSLRVSNAKFKNATGWSPQFPSAREGWRYTVKALSRSVQ
ncbi:MAG: NAD(P)-dependent oxidoreductase [Gordonia amarae]